MPPNITLPEAAREAAVHSRIALVKDAFALMGKMIHCSGCCLLLTQNLYECEILLIEPSPCVRPLIRLPEALNTGSGADVDGGGTLTTQEIATTCSVIGEQYA